MRKPLPQPVSPTEKLLHDIATSLRQLCGDNVSEHPSAKVNLLEPAGSPEPSGEHVCVCGKAAKTAAGLAAHKRSCEAA